MYVSYIDTLTHIYTYHPSHIHVHQLLSLLTHSHITSPITPHTLTTIYHPSHTHNPHTLTTTYLPHTHTTLTCHFLLALNDFSPEISSLAIGQGEVALSLEPIRPSVFIHGCCNAVLAVMRYLKNKYTGVKTYNILWFIGTCAY